MGFSIFALTLPIFAFRHLDFIPRISDRGIVERLTKLEEGQKSLNKRIDDLHSEMNSRFEAIIT